MPEPPPSRPSRRRPAPPRPPPPPFACRYLPAGGLRNFVSFVGFRGSSRGSLGRGVALRGVSVPPTARPLHPPELTPLLPHSSVAL